MSVRNDLGREDGIADVVDDGLLVTSEGLLSRARQNRGGSNTLVLLSRQATSKDCFTDQSDGHASVEGSLDSPLAGTLLTSSVQNRVDDVTVTILVLLLEDITSNLQK